MGSSVALASTDLVLPALTELHDAFGVSLQKSQQIMTTYLAGMFFGLLVWGETGARIGISRSLIIASIGGFVSSVSCMVAPSIEWLIWSRFAEGIFASAAAVFAPSIIQRLYKCEEATQALGRISSIEALVRLIAPGLGLAILITLGWRATFLILAIPSLIIGVIFWSVGAGETVNVKRRSDKPYRAMLRNFEFLRRALGHAACFAGLFVFTVGTPVALVTVSGGQLADYLAVQILSSVSFIIGALSASRLEKSFGRTLVVVSGGLLAGTAAVTIVLLSWWFDSPVIIAYLCLPFVAFGAGLRSPSGFLEALSSVDGNDPRASALILVLVVGLSALMVGISTVYIDAGFISVGIVSSVLFFGSAVLNAPSFVIRALPREK